MWLYLVSEPESVDVEVQPTPEPVRKNSKSENTNTGTENTENTNKTVGDTVQELPSTKTKTDPPGRRRSWIRRLSRSYSFDIMGIKESPKETSKEA